MNLAPEVHRAYAAFLIAHAKVTRSIDRRLRAAGGVGIEVYDVLLALEDAPEHRMRMAELADRVVISRSGVTRLVDRMEKEGLVMRQQCPTDRRGLHAVLTEKGIQAREQAWPVYREAIAEEFGAHMAAEEAAVVAEALGRVSGSDERIPCSRQPSR